MKNLKRILSLALASVMVMGMMVVGASAAEFNDQDKIDHKTAVNTLVALGVIKGKENNNFDPEGKLTRAEMATVLSVILNKGKAPNFGIKEKPTYTDIDGHWAESYIEYCSAFNVVGGIGGGKFDPEGTLTSTQAARMILNAMGYTIEDPSNWALLTEAQARGGDLDLYNGLDEIADPTKAPMTRDQMAQMLFNALSAPVVDKNGNTMTYTKAEKVTEEGAPYYIKALDRTDAKVVALEGKQFGSWAEAWAVGTSTKAADNQPAEMGIDFEITATSSTRTVTTTEIQTLGNRYLGITETAGMVVSVKVGKVGYDVSVKTGSGSVSFTGVEENIASLMGQTVKVLYKGGDVNSVYGVFAQGSEVIFEGAFGDFTAIDNLTATQNKTVTLDGDKVAAADTVTMYVFNDFAKADVHTNVNAITRTNTNAVKEWALKAVANNADGKVDTIVVTPVEATKVANKTSSNLVVSPAVDGKSTIALKATSGAENVVKGDYILVTPMANAVSKTYEIVKAEIVSGTVTGKRTGEYLLDNGEWYSAASTLLPGSKTPSLGAELSLVLVNGYYVYAYAADEANEAANLMILTSVAKDATTSGFTTYVAAKAIFLSDGEEHEIKLPLSAFNVIASGNKLTYSLKVDTTNQLQTYKVEKDGTYTLNATIDPVKDLNLTGVVNDVQYKNGKIDDGTDKYNIADDAVVIVVYKNATKTNTSNTNVTSTVADLTKAGVITGKDLKTWGNITWGATTGIGKAYTGKVSGLNYAKVIYLAADAQTLPNAAGTTDNYGWIMTAPYTTKVKDTEYQTYKLWTGAETVTVNDKNTSNLSLGIGDVITYTDMGDGIIDSTSKTVKTGAVTGYGESVGLIDILDATSKNQTGSVTIDEDTVILFIDTENKVGVDGGAIRLADESELKPGEYANNVHYILNGTGDKVLLLVVETNNDLGSKVDITVPVVVTKDLKSTTFEVTSVTYNNDTKVVKGAASNITLDAKPGMTITLTMKATAADTKTITISDGSNNIGTKASATYAVGDEFTVSCTVQAAGTLVINEA